MSTLRNRSLALKAFDSGVNAAYGYIIARKKYPLQPEPSNPFGTETEENKQWSEGFTETMQKHANWK